MDDVAAAALHFGAVAAASSEQSPPPQPNRQPMSSKQSAVKASMDATRMATFSSSHSNSAREAEEAGASASHATIPALGSGSMSRSSSAATAVAAGHLSTTPTIGFNAEQIHGHAIGQQSTPPTQPAAATGNAAVRGLVAAQLPVGINATVTAATATSGSSSKAAEAAYHRSLSAQQQQQHAAPSSAAAAAAARWQQQQKSAKASSSRAQPQPSSTAPTTTSSSKVPAPLQLHASFASHPPSASRSRSAAPASTPTSASTSSNSGRRSREGLPDASTPTPTAASTRLPPKNQSTTSASPNVTEAPPQETAEAAKRRREKEREREAAREAERENWARTRGAGSSVLDFWEEQVQLQRAWTESVARRRVERDDRENEKERDRNEEDEVMGHVRWQEALKPPSEGSAGSGSGSGGPSGGSSNGSALIQQQQRRWDDDEEQRVWAAGENADSLLRMGVDQWSAQDVLPTLEEVQMAKFEPTEVPSADLLLSRGISEYTILPKILGRGKFSTVFLAVKNEVQYAIKHTPLFPHHQLISTRLLREPTLLAELPPHPNLVSVHETIRTPGHFYLVEEYLGGYVTLEQLLTLKTVTKPPNLPQLGMDLAETVLTQLLSAVHAIHHPLQICHRDIKPENILVHPETLQLKLLDFGLATHFSKSQPKLSTCCGSPAFHCPEIVHALASPPGAVQYWGPEVDAWTCGITMLRVLTGVRYPLGAAHASLRSMAIRAQRAVAMIADPKMRERVARLLDMDGIKRMRYFKEMVESGSQHSAHGINGHASIDALQRTTGPKQFKSTTFIPTEPTHTMDLPLLVGAAAEAHLLFSPPPSARILATVSNGRQSAVQTPINSRAPSPVPSLRPSYPGGSPPLANQPTLVLLNPSGHPLQRLLSFIKYCLRCSGILYHCWPDASSGPPGLLANAMMSDVNLAAFASAHGGTFSIPGSPALEGVPPSPTTPMVTAFGERTDGSGHIYLFECVIELVEPEPEPEQGSLSLVQTIMAAFGRRSSSTGTAKPPNSRSTSTTIADAAAVNAGTAVTGKAKPAPGPSGKDGQIKCLRFYLTVRFPRLLPPQPLLGTATPHSHRTQAPPFSRSSSAYGRRSRASSATGTDTSRAPGSARTSQDLQHHPTVHYAGDAMRRAASVDKAGTHVQAHVQAPSGPSQPQENGLHIITSLDTLPTFASSASVAGSPSRSRNTSRVRVSSNAKRPSGGRKGKVLIQVSDSRALEVVKKALSAGGTHEVSDIDDGSATDGNETDTSSRHGTTRRSMLRAQSYPAVTRSPSRDGSEGGEGETTLRGRQPRAVANSKWLNQHDPNVGRSVAAAVKEESPSSFDIEAMIADCSTNLDRVVRASHILEVADASSPDRSLKAVRDQLDTMSKKFTNLEKTDPNRLVSILSPWTFYLFNSVSLSLGLITDPPPAAETTPGAQPATIRALGADVLQLAARHLSPREVFVAVQERLELMLTEDPRSADVDDEAKPTEVVSPWIGALEMAGLLKVLNTVLPRLQSKKPHKFTESLSDTLPKAARFLISKLSVTRSDMQEGGSALWQSATQELCESLCLVVETLYHWECAMVKQTGSSAAKDASSRQSFEAAPVCSLPVLALFLGGFSALLPALPRPYSANKGETELAEYHFLRQQPKYGFSRPDASPLSPGAVPSQASWEQINNVAGVLDTNLVELALENHSIGSGDSDGSSSRNGVIALGAFLLVVQLLARDHFNRSLGIAPPSQWDATTAEHLLTKSMPMLLAGLSSKLPPTVSASGAAAIGGAGALSNAALLWLMWCLGPLKGTRLQETLSLPLVQLLSSHAALSPVASARHISVKLLTDLLVHDMDESLALSEIKDLINDTTYPPLKAACVGLLKDAMDKKAGKEESLFWTRETFDDILPTILTSVGIPLPDTSNDAALEGSYSIAINAMEERTSWISEVAHFLYFVAQRDTDNKTGIKDAPTQQHLGDDFVKPALQSITRWQSALADETTHTLLSTRFGQDEDLSVPLNIVRVALDRLAEALSP